MAWLVWKRNTRLFCPPLDRAAVICHRQDTSFTVKPLVVDSVLCNKLAQDQTFVGSPQRKTAIFVRVVQQHCLRGKACKASQRLQILQYYRGATRSLVPQASVAKTRGKRSIFHRKHNTHTTAGNKRLAVDSTRLNYNDTMYNSQE